MIHLGTTIINSCKFSIQKLRCDNQGREPIFQINKNIFCFRLSQVAVYTIRELNLLLNHLGHLLLLLFPRTCDFSEVWQVVDKQLEGSNEVPSCLFRKETFLECFWFPVDGGGHVVHKGAAEEIRYFGDGDGVV